MSAVNYSTLLTENNNSNIRVLANQISFQTWGTRNIQTGLSLDTNLSSASNVTVMTLLGSNVGIGSTRPSQSLDVVGNIRFTGNLLNNNNQVAFNWSKSNNVVYVDRGISIGIGTSNTQGNSLYVNGSIVTSNISVLNNFFIANDNLAIRNALQPAAATANFIVQTASQSNFTINQSGIFSATPDKTEVYVNGVKLAYSNAMYKDYDVETYLQNGTDTAYVVTTQYPCSYGDIVDIVVWPSFVSTSATFRAGYIYQQISNTLWTQSGSNSYFGLAGSVGIGNNNPDSTNYKLDITGGCRATGMIANKFYISNWTDNTSNIPNNEFRGPWYGLGQAADFVNDGKVRTQLAGYYGLTLKTANGLVCLTQAGQLGIGTTNTSYFLDVAGTARIGTSTAGQLRITGTSANTELIMSSTNASSDAKTWGHGINADNLLWYSVFDNGTWNMNYMSASRVGAEVTNFTFTPRSNVIIGNATWKCTLDSYGLINARNNILVSGGNIGVGTTLPNEKLHILGSAYVTSQYKGFAGDSATAPSFSWSNDTISGIFLPGASQVAITTGGSEKMRIIANGNVGIGSTNPSVKLDVSGSIISSLVSTNTYTTNTIASIQNIIIQNTTTSTAANIFANLSFQLSPGNTFGSGGRAVCDQRFVRKTAATSESSMIWGACNTTGTTYQDVMELNVNTGNLNVLGDVTCFSVFSDARLKTNVTPIESALERIKNLTPVEYIWRNDIPHVQKQGTPDVGLIAQDVVPLFPRVITNIDVPGTEVNSYLGIKYEKLVPYLVRAIQELGDKYDAVCREVQLLKGLRD